MEHYRFYTALMMLGDILISNENWNVLLKLNIIT